MTAPRAVIFDMDGLMFNTEDIYFEVGSQLMRRRGCEYSRQLNDAVMGCSPQVCFETMIRWHGLSDRWEAMAAESEDLFISLLDGYLAPLPGLLELLDALETAGIPKAICTSSSRRDLTAVLSRFHLEPRFQFTLTAEDITHSKPHPEIYLKATARLELPAHEILVLEDSQTGCGAAADAGTLVAAVPCGYSKNQDFSIASLVLESLADPRLYELLGLRTAG
jgi:HAD superfamily hydrolase (TIGR01509 family)